MELKVGKKREAKREVHEKGDEIGENRPK